MTRVERFAPSPTGPLHLGHAFSALTAFEAALTANGTFLLRIEDIDQERSKSSWEAQIYDDLGWLGITWPSPVLQQSSRMPAYRTALEELWRQRLLYPCVCTRQDIAAASNAPQEGAPMFGPDGRIYPGTCRPGSPAESDMPEHATLRLNMAKAAALLPAEITFEETGPQHAGTHKVVTKDLPETVGDIVLARKTFGTSYHLSVVVDDAFQGVTHVTRGEDLLDATKIHVVLQSLLGLSTPVYHHHRLIRDDAGKRLAKRDDARAISTYRDAGLSQQDIRELIGL